MVCQPACRRRWEKLTEEAGGAARFVPLAGNKRQIGETPRGDERIAERQGGSDVGANTTRAVRDGAEWRLYGEKHFCSNVDAEIFIVLARPDGAPDGPGGLATFIVPRLRADGLPNGFHIRRLKPKLGTRGVPTAEVSLDGAVAWLAKPSERSEPSERPRSGGR